MKVCFATSECVPFVKTGGLADVSGSLPKALADLGCEVKVFLPLYSKIRVFDYGFVFAEDLRDMRVQIGDRTVTCNVWYGHLPDSTVEVYLIDSPHYYHRSGIYTNQHDEDERFLLLQHATFQIMQRYNWAPDILHCNDWQTALMPVFLKKTYNWDSLFHQTASMLSIHNIGYQGLFGPATVHKAGLPFDDYLRGPLEFNDAFSFLKAGILYADAVSTVSETYAHEIQSPKMGAGLDGVLRMRGSDLFGILNGIDPEVWSPSTDTYIARQYDIDSLHLKKENKRALLDRFGLPFDEGVPVFGIVSRLTGQKGFDLLEPILAPLLQEENFQLVVLGSGESHLENFFSWASRAFPDRVATYIGYNEEVAHWIEAGSDAFLMPSHYEPCGLNQMYSLMYGTIPVVRRTGGLADTVHDWHEFYGSGNGFSFYDATAHALYTTMKRALALYQHQPTWQAMQERGMASDFSWDKSAHRYMDVYWHAIHKKRGR